MAPYYLQTSYPFFTVLPASSTLSLYYLDVICLEQSHNILSAVVPPQKSSQGHTTIPELLLPYVLPFKDVGGSVEEISSSKETD
jgi:hypothetical protein